MLHDNALRIASRFRCPLSPGVLVGALALATLSGTHASAQTAYCSTLGGQLYELDFTTGIPTPVFNTGINLQFGIANTPNPDQLLISGVTARINLVDLVAGTVTQLPGPSIPTFAICNNEDDGKIYAISLAQLYLVDEFTGATSLVGPTGQGSVNGLDYHQGIQQLVGISVFTNELISIDPTTGASTVIGPTVPGLVGVWYDAVGGGLYGIMDQNNNGEVYELDVATGAATLLFTTGLNLVSIGGDPGGPIVPTPIGTNYCTANPNSTGVPGVISATGSVAVVDNDVTLHCADLPPGQFGIFVVAQATDSVVVNDGVLCLGGPIGRYNLDVFQIDGGGEASLAIDLTMIPTPSAFVAAAPGDTWYFQAWHRDGTPAMPSSNFTDGLQIDFQ